MITLSMLTYLLMPPQQYDYKPTNYVEVVDFPSEFINAICRSNPEGEIVLGCNNLKLFILEMIFLLKPERRYCDMNMGM